jgi:hypothetical protein
MIESDNGFTTYEGDYEEVLNDLTQMVGSLKLHDFSIPDIMYAVGVGLTYEWVQPADKDTKELLDYIKDRRNGKKQKDKGN